LSYDFLCRTGENEPPREGLHLFRGGEGGEGSHRGWPLDGPN
jgi:hypothetical protein